MSERPVLFNAEMVRAILDGRKTATRRAVKPQPPATHQWQGWILESSCRADEGKASWTLETGPLARDVHRVRCPYGQPGDRLWVRETWAPGATQTMYRAGCSPDYLPPDGKWRPSIHMPRWASRILLEVTDVRVERLQEITIGQICKEGLVRSMYEFTPVTTAFDAFAELWNSTGGDWDSDPWVWVVEFKRIDP